MSAAPSSLRAFVSLEDPFESCDELVQCLASKRKEGRYLEWKQHPPVGPSVSSRSKYRLVKAAVSFANWHGGFVVFGVEPNGDWSGIKETELRCVDPAHLFELINGCVFPEIQQLNYREIHRGDKAFALLHVPPSGLAPHVTTKELTEKDENGKVRIIVARHAVYCRQEAKSDLATPQQHHQLLERRIEALRDELLRRVKEVSVPVLAAASPGRPTSGAATLTIARLTTDPAAPAIRLTRSREGASGVLLHEELSGGLFEEINNVVDANQLLAGGRDAFVMGESIYYRVYAERQHIQPDNSRLSLLARTGLHDFYAPNFFWLLRLKPSAAAEVIRGAVEDLKEPQAHGLIRLVTVLGDAASDWLWARLEELWGRRSQKPDYFFSFRELRQRKPRDPCLAALRTTGKMLVETPGGPPQTAETLLANPLEAGTLLSRACIEVFSGNKNYRQSARQLDVLTHGRQLAERAAPLVEELVR